MTPRYAFLLQRQLQMVDDLSKDIKAIDARIGVRMSPCRINATGHPIAPERRRYHYE